MLVEQDPYYNLVLACVLYSLKEPIIKNSKPHIILRDLKETYKSRMNFANSKLLMMFCDLSNIDYNKVRKEIIKFNTNYFPKNL